MHDERYKTIFAFPRMVEDLLRGFAARRWAGELDFAALRKLSADYVSDDRLRRQLRRPGDGELRRAFTSWVQETAKPFLPPGETLPPEMTLEEIEMTLVERAAEWSNQWVREGVEKGLRQGLEQGLEKGFERGRKEGLAHERALLRRVAASRFGVETAERLSEALDGIEDPERLAGVGEWLVRSPQPPVSIALVRFSGRDGCSEG